MKTVDTMEAVNLTIDKYMKHTEDTRNGAPLDEEDIPVIGIFNNGMVIVNFVDGEIKIDVKGGDPMYFNADISIFGSKSEAVNEV